jgi:hypothetical protein
MSAVSSGRVNMRAASERFAELRDLIDVHGRDDHGDPAC